MGTLFDQPRRDYRSIGSDDVATAASRIASLCKETGLKPGDIIALMRVLEMRRASDLYASNCDVLRLCSAIEAIGVDTQDHA